MIKKKQNNKTKNLAIETLGNVKVTQPQLYCEKELYNEYRVELKKAGRDLVNWNSMIFTRGVQKELEALKRVNAGENQKLYSDSEADFNSRRKG